jgi:hypothetical protein
MPASVGSQAGKRKVIHLRGLAQARLPEGAPVGQQRKLLLTVTGADGFLLVFHNANHSLSHVY